MLQMFKPGTHVEVEGTEDGLVPRFGYTRERAHVVAGSSLQRCPGLNI